MMLLSYTIVDFYIFYDGAADWYAKWSLLTRSLCRVSDTQATVQACEPFVYAFKDRKLDNSQENLLRIFTKTHYWLITSSSTF